jgi:3-deoxy-D-manno-octulosonic-acid transferase
MGPNYANFRAITEDLRAHDALRIADQGKLAQVVIDLLANSDKAEAMGARARRVFAQQSGETGRCVEAIRGILDRVAAHSATFETKA